MKMKIRLSLLDIEKKGECRICFCPAPFSMIGHKYCQHSTSICSECFTKWFLYNGQCDLCRKNLFPRRTYFYIVQNEKTKIYYKKKQFLKSLNDVKKKDLDILITSIQLFKRNFNLIEQYEFNITKKKIKKILLFKVFNDNIISTIKLYLLLTKHEKDSEVTK